MRTTQKVCLCFCLVLLFLGNSEAFFAQSTMNFKYGEKEEFQGSLTAYLIMIGVDRESGQRSSRILRPSNYTIQYDRYDDLKIVLRITSLELAKEEHYETSWLEIPLYDYINEDLPGLVLESRTKVLMLGSDDIPRARETGDIRYSIDPSLDREVEGAILFSFDFISSDFPWKKIKFHAPLQYAIRSPLPVDQMAEKVPLNELKETSVEAPSAAKEELNEIEEELPPADLPEKVTATSEEETLMRAIEETSDVAKIRELCVSYRDRFPNGYYLEEVLYRQILATPDLEKRSRHLEDYVEWFPEGKHIIQVNDMIFSDLSKNELPENVNPTEVVEVPERSLQASIKMKDGILSVNEIKGGQPPFRLEFFDANGEKEKKYAIDIGKNRAFKINLKSLPLEKNTYVIGLVDEEGSQPYYSGPLNVSTADRSFKVEVPFLSMVLGISILVIAAFLLVLSRFFSKKRRRRRGRYTSNSYR